MLNIQIVNSKNPNEAYAKVPLKVWEKLNNKISKFEQAEKIKKSLKKGILGAKEMHNSDKKQKNLIEFLNEI